MLTMILSVLVAFFSATGTTYPEYTWEDGLLLNSYTQEELKKLLK